MFVNVCAFVGYLQCTPIYRGHVHRLLFICLFAHIKLNIFTSEGSESSTHYLSDKNRFDVSSKGPSSGISSH